MKTDGVKSAPDGAYEERFKDGSLAAEGFVSGGKKHGHWRYYYAKSGALKAEGAYDHDGFTGRWAWWREDGKTQQEGAFVDNLQHGEWTRWYPNGQVWDTGRYEMGKKVGPWRAFNPDGTLKAEKVHKG